MKTLKSLARSVYTSQSVRQHAVDLVKVIVGVVLAHYGIKYG